MQGQTIIYFILALGLLVSSVASVCSKRILRSAIFLAAALVFTAFLYLLLGAELLAGIQILLYVGGVITLIIFALLISEKLGSDQSEATHRNIIPAAIASTVLFLILLFFTYTSRRISALATSSPTGEFGASGELSELIFTDWVLPLEVLSLLLLAAIIGALVIARREHKQEGEQ
ncbi:MAG: NADH-quinone oxidoreductase subunit J [Thermodesulfobacteriota bacterium]